MWQGHWLGSEKITVVYVRKISITFPIIEMHGFWSYWKDDGDQLRCGHTELSAANQSGVQNKGGVRSTTEGLTSWGKFGHPAAWREKESHLLVGWCNADDFIETGKNFDVLSQRSTLWSTLYIHLWKDWPLPKTHVTGVAKRHEGSLLKLHWVIHHQALSAVTERLPKIIETLEASLNDYQTRRWPMNREFLYTC